MAIWPIYITGVENNFTWLYVSVHRDYFPAKIGSFRIIYNSRKSIGGGVEQWPWWTPGAVQQLRRRGGGFSLHWWKVRGFFDFWIVLGGAWTSSWLQQLDRGGLWKTLCVEMHLQTKFLFYFSLISLSSSLFWLLTPISFQIMNPYEVNYIL